MNFSIKNKKLLKIIALVFLCISTIIGTTYYYHTYHKTGIYEFNKNRDACFIKKLFQDDWYWLVAGVSDTYDDVAKNYVNHFLKHKTTRRLASDKKNVTVKVAYDANNFVGFVAYFVKKFYLGKLLFIDVVPEYRSKKWGFTLLKRAIDDLKKEGVSQVELITRTNNIPAQKLYNRFGFQETEREDGFVNFMYTIP